jgi:uncharacterized repeat protein (TIGR03837 family)
MNKNWHIFCRVVDNFGDIGVCWRLAKSLHFEHQQQVTLWVDDLTSFHAICPQVQQQKLQQVQGIRVLHWNTPLSQSEKIEDAQVVIEAFACELPSAIIEKMKALSSAPLWINLEYLSAEAWVEGVHALPSPVQGLNKIFFFPGFGAKTGGLLWEKSLLELAQQGRSVAAKSELLAYWQLPSAYANYLTLSLFSYENPQLPNLLTALCTYSQPVHLWVPQGRISAQVQAWLGEPLQAGKSFVRGQLHLSVLPFMEQSQFDKVLAACDFNLVRGEESFVRTQMLARPFIWHIYPQDDGAHWVKLEAFLARYLAGFSAAQAAQLRQVFMGWNSEQEQPIDWHGVLDGLGAWQAQAQAWQEGLQKLGSLSTNLVRYAQIGYDAAHF